jgi:2,3-dihydroxyphenylpropionate 1,2-dioxygenase
MPLDLHCLSHTPILGQVPIDPATDAEVRGALAATRDSIAAFDPELVILFAPDHYSGFFHGLMPSFCVGIAADSIGDYGSSGGALDVPEEIALDCVRACHADGVDVAFSRAMQVDHGFAQPLDLVCGGLTRYPVVPVFINAAGQPVAPIARSRALGAAIGRYLARDHPERRVVVIGSGGLSHDPPVPQLDTAPPEIRARLIAGGARPPSVQKAHEGRVIAAAMAFSAADPLVGGGTQRPLNPAWDRHILDLLASGNFDALDALDNADITRDGGIAGHEIRTWVAAHACLDAVGPWRADPPYYRPVADWMAGFAVSHAAPLALQDA